MQHSKFLENLSAGDLLARRLGNEGRARKSSLRSGSVDLIDQSLIERDVYPHGSAGIGQQRNGEQHSSFLDRGFDVLVAKDAIYVASRSKVSSGAFKRFRMLAQGSRRVGNGFFQSVACRKASLDIRKPDAEGAIGLFFNYCYVLCRHRFAFFSRPPPGQLVNPAYQTGRQVFSRVRHGDDRMRFRMFERVVIATDPIESPSVSFQHRDQLAAVSFHRPLEASETRFWRGPFSPGVTSA